MLAQDDPILYFNIIELLCRTRSWDTWGIPSVESVTGIYVLLHPRFSDPEQVTQLLQRLDLQQLTEQQKHQQQRKEWQICKAALSAYASWAKAYTKLLKAYSQSLRYTPETAGTASADPYLDLFKLLAENERTLLLWVASSSSPSCANSRELQLLLLLWRARVVVVTAEHLGLRSADAQAAAVGGRGGGTTSSMTGGSSGSSSSAGSIGGPSALLLQMSNSSSMPGGGSSSSSGGSGAASDVLAQMACDLLEEMRCEILAEQRGCGSSGSSCSSSSMPVLGRSSDLINGAISHASRVGGNAVAGLLIVASHYHAVRRWHKLTHAAGTEAKPAPAGIAGDASRLRDDADSNLSKRLLRLPDSLPPAVVGQLDHISSTYTAEVLARQQQAEEDSISQQQVELLQKMLRVSELLLAEVPCTLGCSNPGCVDLSGSSEEKVSSRVCSGCKVVCYCSKECQNAHWKRHKGLCKKLGAGPSGCAGK